MTGLVLLLGLLQQRPTVGDTVWLVTRVPLAPRQILRPQTWELGDLGQVLGPPVVELGPDSATVSYPVSFWYPGEHDVAVPGPIVVNPEGRSDTLPARPLRVSVATVLPAGVPKDSITPRDPAALVTQAVRSPLPLGVFGVLVAAIAGLVGARLVRLRRPRTIPGPERPPPLDPRPLLDRWVAAGESTVALDGWARLVAETRGRRGDPDGGAEALETAFTAIGFRADANPAEVERLVRAAKAWLERAE